MKKLLTVLAASVGIAAFAVDTPPLSATSFEGYTDDFSVTRGDAGGDPVPDGDRTWAGTDADGDTNVITAYGDATPPANRPDYYATSNQVNFLKVDSTAGLARFVKKGGVAQGLTDSNVYFDMDVQFTVSDSVQGPADGDKLLVWLYAPDASGNEAVATNLIITAATLDNQLTVTATHFVVPTENAAIEPDTWHRLTVVTEKKTVDGESIPYFQVYLDGNTTPLAATGKLTVEAGSETVPEKVTVTAMDDSVSSFASLVNYDDAAAITLTSVTFKGTGAVDDLVVTTVKPSFIQEEVYFQVGEDKFKTFTEALGAVAANDTEITLLADVTETIVVDTSYDIILNLNDKSITSDDEEKACAISIDANSTGKLTITGTGYVVCTADGGDSIMNDGEATVVINGGYYSPVFTQTYTTTVSGKKIGTTVIDNVTYSCLVDEESSGRTINGGAGTEKNVTVSADTVSAAAAKFDVSAASVTDTQILAYIVGGTVVNDKAVVPTPTISVNGTTVTVVCSGADSDYLVQYYLDYKTDLTAAEWTLGTTPVAATGDDYTATLKDEDATAPQKFYRVRAVVSNK